MLRRFFADPGFYEHWDGHPKSDDELLAKYTGGRSPSVECFIVEVDAQPVGLVQYYALEEGGGGGIDLALLPAARRRGIGTAVVEAVVRFVRDQRRWRRLIVDPEVSNESGVRFWERVGFVTERVVEDDDGRAPYWVMSWPYGGE